MPKPMVRLEKRSNIWAVVMRSGSIAYSSTCYAKAVGVSEYLEIRRKAQEAEIAADQRNACIAGQRDET